MPKWVAPTLLLMATLSLIPFACVARSRVVRSPKPAYHLWPDMDDQGSYKAQQANPEFADGRAMRPPVAGTVARGALTVDDHLELGLVDDQYAEDFPLPLTMDLMRRGRQRYDVFCAPCHGLAGHGDGIVGKRAEALQQGTWVPPSSFHAEPASTRPIGHIYNTISNGIRNMPAYGPQIPVEDRWAITAYVKALQRSQKAALEDVPKDQRAGLR